MDKDLLKGAINLIVQALTLEDAGTYECQDEKGFGETASAQLIVLGLLSYFSLYQCNHYLIISQLNIAFRHGTILILTQLIVI